jgi:hypothetical protein
MRTQGCRPSFATNSKARCNTHTAEELKWYFEQVRSVSHSHQRPVDDRFIRAADAFLRHRFHALYRRWIKDDDSALDEVSSIAIRDALTFGAGSVESNILPHRYEHLSPIFDTARSKP